uniref:Salivary protein n=1 Tax=Simulium nigrimanum TaxID=683695 RepID=D1FPV5_SIMNI
MTKVYICLSTVAVIAQLVALGSAKITQSCIALIERGESGALYLYDDYKGGVWYGAGMATKTKWDVLDGERLKNQATGKCLYARPQKDGAINHYAGTKDCGSGDDQKWTLDSDGRVRNVQTGTELSLSEANYSVLLREPGTRFKVDGC